MCVWNKLLNVDPLLQPIMRKLVFDASGYMRVNWYTVQYQTRCEYIISPLRRLWTIDNIPFSKAVYIIYFFKVMWKMYFAFEEERDSIYMRGTNQYNLWILNIFKYSESIVLKFAYYYFAILVLDFAKCSHVNIWFPLVPLDYFPYNKAYS